MDFNNNTQFPGLLFRAILESRRNKHPVFRAAAFARVTFDIVEDRLQVSDDQVWPVSFNPWESEYGNMDGDGIFCRGGVDLLIFGHVRTQNRAPVSQLDISIEVGKSFHRRLVVFGDRTWCKKDQRLYPSNPEPFSEIALQPEYAFGGHFKWDGLTVRFPANPIGKGFFFNEKEAVGGGLPNFEDLDHLIRNWDDRPLPVGFGPCLFDNPLRIGRAFYYNKDGTIDKLNYQFYNSAHPGMIVPSVQPGDRVCLTGFSETGAIEFSIPDIDLCTTLRFNGEAYTERLFVDQIGIEVDRRRVFVSYRYPFRYKMIALQKRSCELFLAESNPDRESRK